MSNLEEHEAEQARITQEWEERAAPFLPEPPGPDAKRWYVTMTWDNWPEGGSYGATVTANDSEHAERIARWEMAQSREEFDHPAEAYDSYSHEWYIVDCFLVEDFLARHT